LAFSKAHSKKGISHAYHRFNSQCVTLFFGILAIISLQIPTGEKKNEERKEEKK